MHRPTLGARAFVSVVLCATLFLAGCSAAWVSTVDSLLAAAAPALISILEIVAVSKGIPVNFALETKINADAAALKKLAGDFASNSGVSGACANLNAAVATFQADESAVLQIAQVSNPGVQAKISLLTNLIVAAINSIELAVPSCQVVVARADAAPPIAARNFARDFNRALDAPSGNAAVDAVAKAHHVPTHGKLVRILSLGLAR